MGYGIWVLALVLLEWLVIRVILVIPLFGIQNDGIMGAGGVKVKSGTGANSAGLRLFVFLGSGGHTGEMLRLLDNYKDELLRPGTKLIVGSSDEESLTRFHHSLGPQLAQQVQVTVCRFGKAREVGASKLESVRSILHTLAKAIWTVTWIKWQFVGQPHLVLLNGPGTCCIIAGWLKLLEIITMTRSKIVYVESLARTDSLSMSGKILYPLVDEFVVQWSELCEVYERAQCFGILV
ncbi:LANO_0F12992g1_1 [Lachancea nothofagi CBS 11611]|uniref:UDP-N-acetylglucosamine transferase subunit ALG14 n=1 Tax=Lachancea nothofagi CBS 11611 TaxID=1266666 RepID=A0A1G4KBL2_9SACH|nr:LANO_0F12992g1_1 [Lachancea nothofagi CBS 11611]